MQALVLHAAHDLRLEDRALSPLEPGQVRVRLAVGGVCGSDLHYYHDGGVGAARLREPMILGHEVSGFVAELGAGVEGLAVGDLVALNPSRPCGACVYCLEGLPNHCLHMRFYGSAMPFPHVQGAFREEIVADAAQCVPAEGLSPAEAALAEPLAVCLHAVRRAGEMLGKRVLVTGCGPIGVLCVMAARRAGAAEIVATDQVAAALAHATKAGADRTIDVTAEPGALEAYALDKGYFDVLFEASGAQAALGTAIATMRPRGVVVQVGMGGDMRVPMHAMTVKELDLRGSFRFHAEFAVAVGMMARRLIDVRPLVTHTLPLAEAEQAFVLASDRNQAMKAQIAFTDKGGEAA